MKRGSGFKGASRAAGAFAAGAAAGSVLGLLLAPHSGPSTRKKVASRLNKTKKLINKKANILRDTAVDQIEQTRDWLVSHVPSTNGHSKNGHSKRSAPRKTTRRAA